MRCRCFRSMRKREETHSLQVTLENEKPVYKTNLLH